MMERWVISGACTGVQVDGVLHVGRIDVLDVALQVGHLLQHILLAGAYTRFHFRSTCAYLPPFRSSQAYFVPHVTQINPWMWPEGAQVEL